MFKKILVILLTVMLTMTTLVGCKWYTGENPPYGLIHEDYSYHYNKGTIAVTKEKASGVTIEEVLEKSREKKSLIIPTFIDNLPVTHLGFHRFMAGDSFIESSEFCEKLYIPHTVIMVNDVDVMSKKTNFRRVAFLFDKQEGEMTKVNWDNRKIFLENFLLSYESGIELETLDEFAFLVPKMFYQEYWNMSAVFPSRFP